MPIELKLVCAFTVWCACVALFLRVIPRDEGEQ